MASAKALPTQCCNQNTSRSGIFLCNTVACSWSFKPLVWPVDFSPWWRAMDLVRRRIVSSGWAACCNIGSQQYTSFHYKSNHGKLGPFSSGARSLNTAAGEKKWWSSIYSIRRRSSRGDLGSNAATGTSVSGSYKFWAHTWLLQAHIRQVV